MRPVSGYESRRVSTRLDWQRFILRPFAHRAVIQAEIVVAEPVQKKQVDGGGDAAAAIGEHALVPAHALRLEFCFGFRQFAKNFDKQPEVKEALMKAYFSEGIDLSKQENLVAVAAQCGMDADTVRKFLQSDEKTETVRSLEQLNQQRGISGVPFYIFNNKYGVSGAQPSEAFLEILTSPELTSPVPHA